MSIDSMKGFISIPRDVLLSKDIQPVDKLLYGAILSLARYNEGKYTDKKNKVLQDYIQSGEATVPRGLHRLEDAGFITVNGASHTRRIYPKSPLTERSDTPVKEVAPKQVLSEERYRHIKKHIDEWGKRVTIKGKPDCVAGTQHRIAKPGKSQGTTVWQLHTYMEEAEDSLLSFFKTHEDALDPVWKSRYCITEANIKASSVTLKQALWKHLCLLRDGVYEDNKRILTKNLRDFYLQEQINKKTGTTIITSWLLYWICRPFWEETQEEKETEVSRTELQPPKYISDDIHTKWKQFYKRIPKEVFQINPVRDSIQVQNDVTRHIDSILDKIYPWYQDDIPVKDNLKSLPVSAFVDYYVKYHTGDSWPDLPKMIASGGLGVCSVNSKTWNLFLDYIASKGDTISYKWKKNYKVLYNNKKDS